MTKTFEDLEAKVDALAKTIAALSGAVDSAPAYSDVLHERMRMAETNLLGDRSRVLALRDRVANLETLLHGDRELRAKYEKTPATYPNIPEPPPGFIDAVHSAMALQDLSVQTLSKFAAKLQAFFGPLIEGKNPPLDGEQIASKAFVDRSLATFAGAIREEIRLSASVKLAEELIRKFGSVQVPVADLKTLIDREHKRVRDTEEQANRPSRLKSLLYALTGRATERT